jgi:uncharacterized alkaline shock family protein YloU
MTEEKTLGRVEISPHAIAAIAGEAVLRCYGVVGMANKNLIDGLAEVLQPERWQRGVDVQIHEAGIVVNLYVIVQYGTRISEVAHGVMHGVTYALEQALGLPVAEVNVHGQGLRMSNGEK